jgi:hypothetical protein
MPRSISRRQSSRDGVRNSPLSKVSEILSFWNDAQLTGFEFEKFTFCQVCMSIEMAALLMCPFMVTDHRWVYLLSEQRWENKVEMSACPLAILAWCPSSTIITKFTNTSGLLLSSNFSYSTFSYRILNNFLDFKIELMLISNTF